MKIEYIVKNLVMDENLIANIINLFKETDPYCNVKIAVHEKEEDNIYFIMDTEKSLFRDIGLLSLKLKAMIGCEISDEEENIIIEKASLFKEGVFEKLFQKNVDLSIDNISNVKAFLKNNYPACFKKEEEKKISVTNNRNIMFATTNTINKENVSNIKSSDNNEENEKKDEESSSASEGNVEDSEEDINIKADSLQKDILTSVYELCTKKHKIPLKYENIGEIISTDKDIIKKLIRASKVDNPPKEDKKSNFKKN